MSQPNDDIKKLNNVPADLSKDNRKRPEGEIKTASVTDEEFKGFVRNKLDEHQETLISLASERIEPMNSMYALCMATIFCSRSN